MLDDQLDEDALNFAVKWQGEICGVVVAVLFAAMVAGTILLFG